MERGRYLFGDSDIAARRLELLARVYRESTRAFLLEAAGGARIGLAIDLGCGPGFTTSLIANTLACDRVLGLDASEAFIALAREANASERVSFGVHDVTAAPLPYADLIFCRLLLTHLKEPGTALARWAAQLNAGGLLMVEEVEAIDTQHPVFSRYLALVEAMLAAQANRLYIGGRIASFALPGVVAAMNQSRTVAVRNRDAAGMFSMNLRTWKDGEFVRANYPRGEIDRLERELEEMAAGGGSESAIVWRMRQAGWRRQ